MEGLHMTVKELYESIGGNYDEVLKRLMMDKLVDKFILKFLEDNSCSSLVKAWDDQDATAIFEASHAAKGVCANLALTPLTEVLSTITEAYRPGKESSRDEAAVNAAYEEFKKIYPEIMGKIAVYRDSNN